MHINIDQYKKYEPIFNAFYIKEFLGEGSFGKVFLIERESFSKKYDAALKIITIPQSKSDLNNKLSYLTEANAKTYYKDIVNSIVSEFHLMSKLKGHSHIVSYEDHDVIQHESGIGWDILIRMEFLTPLQQHVNLQNISLYDVIRLGIDICKALERCQKEGIIHRDIKPENIFVTADGNYKLGDFGVARTIEKSSGDFTRIGTPPYMAPEIHKGTAYASCIDIYSLGLVVYRLLNKNRMPFLPVYPKEIEPGDEELAISKRVKGNKMPSPIDADKKLAEIVLKACAFKPQNRYQTPEEMRNELENYQRDISVDINIISTDNSAIKKDSKRKKSSEPVAKTEEPILEKPIEEKQTPAQHLYGTTKIGSQNNFIENYSEPEGNHNKTEVLIKPEPVPPVTNVQESSWKQQKPISGIEKKQLRIGYILCVNCGAEIRRDSISCISCRRQLR